MPEATFRERFGPGPVLAARAPGRVNLIGEHTDYNGGYVFPMAIDREIRIVCRPTGDGRVTLVSMDFDGECTFDLADLDKARAPDWAHYFMGVAHVLQDEGHTLRGIEAVIQGNVPLGAGLSSSAAVEVASAMALCEAAEVRLPREKLALICQRAENEFIGVNCGIMDQFASLLCRENHALMIDCTTLEHTDVPLYAEEAAIVVCDTKVKHALIDSPYNQRRKEAAKAFRLLQRHMPGIETYRDIDVDTLAEFEHDLPDPLNRRARHVVRENGRVLYGVACLEKDDLIGFGALMDASHESLKNDYEVSCAELDCLVELAREQAGTYGSRMTGGGFGGCTVSLVRPDSVEAFCAKVSQGFEERFGHKPDTYIFSPSEGATLERKELA